MDRYVGLPSLPERINRLDELATDLWWSWQVQARRVFRTLDYGLWRSSAHNPVHMLWTIPRERLDQIATDPEFLSLYDSAIAGLDSARQAKNTWARERYPELNGRPIAYFSAEFALHQSLPIYAGGLGVLAGDHCKEASDLGVPLVGIGFMYPQGYFHQHLSSEGWQEEVYERINWADTPIEPATSPEGQPIITAVPLGTRTVLVAVWRVRLGRVTLYLLDTGLEENAPWDRELSARLYGGDRETRVQQEIILGIGGVRALHALGIEPAVWHLNEGHASFVALQRIREVLERGASFEDALTEVRRTTVFTTHTPVPAGHDAFPFQLIETHLAGCWGGLGGHREKFLALGEHNNGAGAEFNMTALALRTAGVVNGVSRAHSEVTRQMWTSILDEGYQSQPLTYVTNGVHVATWVAAEMAQLFDRHLSPAWRDRHDEPEFWDGVLSLPDEDLWTVRGALRQFLFAFIRDRARQQWTAGQVSAASVVASGTLLDPSALTLGFARRFAGYKRPDLVFRDPNRLARILNAPGRPMQIVFAGKSHPADDVGQAPSSARLQAGDGPDVRGADRFRGRLRPPRGPFPGAGLRRLDEHAAEAPRSKRHQRHEGRHQRRAPFERRRWLVGRRLQRDEWMADRRRRRARGPRRTGCRRRRLALPSPRGAGRPHLLRSRRAAASARVAPSRQGSDPHGDATFLHAPDGQAVRRAHVRPCHQTGGHEVSSRARLLAAMGGAKITRMPRKSTVKSRCALCGAKEISEPRGEERYCRDCWDKKIAVEEIVAREFALKRYIRAHSAEKYLIYHSTIKRPCGQLIVVDDGYDLFLTIMLYPNFGWDEGAYHLEGDPEGRTFAEILVDVVATEVIEPWGGGKWHLEIFRSVNPEPEDWNGEM